MCLVCIAGYGSASFATLATSMSPSISLQPADFSSMRQTIAQITLPEIEQPEWLKGQIAAESAKSSTARAASAQIAVTYSVSTRGSVRADLAEFKSQANQTLNDARGWARMNVRFNEVPSGGNFSLVLADAASIGAQAGCSSDYSCRVGRTVYINQERWLGATPSWNNAGGSLRDYRHMVVNHEVGHWLGHGHESCSTPGGLAPVMQQQSMDLQGCRFNPWPLDSELRSSQLGI